MVAFFLTLLGLLAFVGRVAVTSNGEFLVLTALIKKYHSVDKERNVLFTGEKRNRGFWKR